MIKPIKNYLILAMYFRQEGLGGGGGGEGQSSKIWNVCYFSTGQGVSILAKVF